MGKKSLLIVVLIVSVIIVALIIENKTIVGNFIGMKKNISIENSASVPTVAITYGNIEQILSESSLIKELPNGASILLRFYNFNSGQRQWESSYIIERGRAKEGYTEQADIIVVIHSKYLGQLTNKNFCGIILTAKANGDLGIETKLSSAKLLWKYKGMLKYRECFGF